METKFVVLAQELQDIQEKIKFLETKKESIKDYLKDICGNQTFSFNGYTFSKIERPGSVKYSEIPELKGVNLDIYRSEPVVVWKLSCVKQFNI